MAGIHALDRLIGNDYPDLATDEEVRAFEQVPYADRVAAESTYDAIRLGAARNPDGPAIQFLQNADPADTPVVVTYRDFIARVTQAANMFHALGVEKGDVVSFMLPLLPDAFVTLFGAEAADIAAYFHTGGTTGTPKLVRHTHVNQVYQAWALNLLLKSKPGANMLFGMPLFHVGGSLTQVLTTLSAGGSLVVLSPSGWRNPNAVKNIWQLVERFKPEALSSVPTVLAATLAVPPGDADISSLKYAAGGGSAIPVAVGSAIQDKLKLPVVEVYGMTETSSVPMTA